LIQPKYKLEQSESNFFKNWVKEHIKRFGLVDFMALNRICQIVMLLSKLE
jgi:hypothetical protein